MAKVKFTKAENNLPPIEEGQFIYNKNTHGFFLDVTSTDRIELNPLRNIITNNEQSPTIDNGEMLITAQNIGALPITGGVMKNNAIILISNDSATNTIIDLTTKDLRYFTRLYAGHISFKDEVSTEAIKMLNIGITHNTQPYINCHGIIDNFASINATVLKYNGKDINTIYIRPDKHAKIYNNFDVYAKGTTANPLLKIRPDRIDIFKTDGDEANGIKATSRITIGNSIDINTDVTMDASTSFYTLGNLFAKHIGLSGNATIDFDNDFYIKEMPASNVPQDWNTPVLYGGGSWKIGYNQDLLSTSNVVPQLKYGFQITNVGNCHIYGKNVHIGEQENYMFESSAMSQYPIRHNIKLRNGMGLYIEISASNSAISNAERYEYIYLNGNVKLCDDNYVVNWNSNVTQLAKTLLSGDYTLQNVLAALIKKTNLTLSDVTG